MYLGGAVTPHSQNSDPEYLDLCLRVIQGAQIKLVNYTSNVIPDFAVCCGDTGSQQCAPNVDFGLLGKPLSPGLPLPNGH